MLSYKHSIAIIIPYFGKLPWYFKYFIHTCKYNLSVHVFIITDDFSYDNKVPANVFILHKTFKELKIIISEKLQLKTVIIDTYKLCDFKPAYGVIFSELITGYDFWGMGDLDVIYGDIRNFMTAKILNEYDVITVRHDFLVGYFTLFKNCKKINEAFRESKDYVKVFTSSEHYCFDECNFAFWKMTHEIRFEDVECEIESMTHVVKNLASQNKLRAYFDVHAIEGKAGRIKWNKGKLTYKNEYEIMLYHLIQFKKIFDGNSNKDIPDMFRISSSRIYW